MRIEDLKPGDILVLSGGDNCISELIRTLTYTPGYPRVSHGALSYTSYDKVVEETLPAIRVSDAVSDFKGETVHVVRLTDYPESMGPVTDAAGKYLNKKEPYAIANLVLLGLLLVYKRYTPSGKAQKKIIEILKFITSEVISLIDKIAYPGKKPMVCSQLVYQCYLDAGYRLDIEKPVLAAVQAAQPNLLDHAIASIGDISQEEPVSLAAGMPSLKGKSKTDIFEKLCCELLKLIEKEKGEKMSVELAGAAGQFAMAVHSASMGMDMNKVALTGALEFLKYNEADFVAPVDLLKCRNAKEVGTIVE